MADWVKISTRDGGRIQGMLRWFEKDNPRQPEPMRRTRRGDIGGAAPGTVQLAKTQEAATATGEISVKLLDSSDNETGEAFDVFVFSDEAATDFTSDYWLSDIAATMPSGKVIEIAQFQNGNWHMTNPVLLKITACP